MFKIKELAKILFVPEISVIALFVIAGYCSGNVRLNPAYDILSLIILIIVCFFSGSQILQAFLSTPRQDIRTPHKLLALFSLVAVIIPPFISYGQGWNAFIVTSIMFCFVVGFGIPRSYFFRKLKQFPGLDVMLRSITWGCLSMSVGALFSSLEPITRSWLIVLLGFYLYSSFYLMVEMQSSKSMEEKPTVIMYLGESRTIELIAILQLFGVVGLTTLYLSEYDSFNTINLTFYSLFTLIGLINIFNLLVWSKEPMRKKRFSYLFFVISINLYLSCWVVAEWFYH